MSPKKPRAIYIRYLSDQDVLSTVYIPDEWGNRQTTNCLAGLLRNMNPDKYYADMSNAYVLEDKYNRRLPDEPADKGDYK